MKTQTTSNSTPNPSQRLYRTIWRWHFYAGLFCVPFIILLAITGSIYLFKPDLEAFRESDFTGLAVNAERALPNQQIQTAIDAVPGASFTAYRLPQQADDAVRISVLNEGSQYYVYVNPFTLEVLNITETHSVLVEWVKNLHGELLMGDNGSLLVELAASWAIVLFITGLYLWWPRNAKGPGGVIYPRINLGGRLFWKDMHAVTGFWIAFFALFLLVSGLPWTTVWGGAFKETRRLVESVTTQDWNTSSSARQQSWRSTAASHFDLQPHTLDTAKGLGFAWPAELSVANSKTNEWKLASQTQNRPQRQTAWIDGHTGIVTDLSTFADKRTLDKVIGIGIAAHEGHLFGRWNQLLGVLTALGLVTLAVSGLIMWLKRKPGGSLGAPARHAPGPVATAQRAVVAITLVAAVLLPMLGMSLLAIMVLEFSYRQIRGITGQAATR